MPEQRELLLIDPGSVRLKTFGWRPTRGVYALGRGEYVGRAFEYLWNVGADLKIAQSEAASRSEYYKTLVIVGPGIAREFLMGEEDRPSTVRFNHQTLGLWRIYEGWTYSEETRIWLIKRRQRT